MNRSFKGSLKDLTWLKDGLVKEGEITYDPSGSKNPNNVKKQLQKEWGYEMIDPIFEDDIAGVVERNIPKKDLGDASQVVLFARNLMNTGASSDVVDRALRSRFEKNEMKKSSKSLRKLFEMDGIIGRVAVDATGYNSCNEALVAANKSPYKHFIKSVIGCSCGDPVMIPVEDENMVAVASSGNAMDDFFENDKTYEPCMVAHCQSTMLPLFAADELDEQWSSDVLIDMNNMEGISLASATRLRDLDVKPLEKVKKAFQILDQQRLRKGHSKYSTPVDVSEFSIKVADNEIELASMPQPDIEIDPVNHAIQQIAVVDPKPKLKKVGRIDMVAEMTDFELSEKAAAQDDDIQMPEYGRINLFEKREAEAPLDIDPTAGDYLSDEFPDILTEVDLDLSPELNGIFAGVDEIELEPEKTATEELDIDMNPEFEW